MKIVETEAIILKSQSLGDADKIILCLTRKAGLVRLSVRGAKRLKSRFTGSLEPFTVADIIYTLKEDQELGRLSQSALVESYFHLAARLNILNSLSYLAELLAAMSPPQEPNEKLYRMVKAALEAIEAVKEDLTAVRYLVSYFELWLLRLGGFLPDFQSCVRCHTKIKDKLDKTVYYRPVEARLICADCADEHDFRANPLAPRLYQFLRAALGLSPLKFVEYAQRLAENQENVDAVTHRLLRKILEYEPRYWSHDFELEESVRAVEQTA
jgi:DNA repair protein RecO (recombination protein O)